MVFTQIIVNFLVSSSRARVVSLPLDIVCLGKNALKEKPRVLVLVSLPLDIVCLGKNALKEKQEY